MRWVNYSDPIILLNEIILPDFTLTEMNTSRVEEVSGLATANGKWKIGKTF